MNDANEIANVDKRISCNHSSLLGGTLERVNQYTWRCTVCGAFLRFGYANYKNHTDRIRAMANELMLRGYIRR